MCAIQQKMPRRAFFVVYYLEFLSTNFAIRDFLLEAAFFLITPTLAALSKAWNTFGSISKASLCFFWRTKARVSLMTLFNLLM